MAFECEGAWHLDVRLAMYDSEQECLRRSLVAHVPSQSHDASDDNNCTS